MLIPEIHCTVYFVSGCPDWIKCFVIKIVTNSYWMRFSVIQIIKFIFVFDGITLTWVIPATSQFIFKK